MNVTELTPKHNQLMQLERKHFAVCIDIVCSVFFRRINPFFVEFVSFISFMPLRCLELKKNLEIFGIFEFFSDRKFKNEWKFGILEKT